MTHAAADAAHARTQLTHDDAAARAARGPPARARDAIAAFRRFKTLQPHSDLARDYLRRAEEERKAAEQRCEASRARGKEHCEDYDCEVCGGPPEHYFGDVDLDWSQFDADGFIGDRDRYFVPPAEADRLSPCEGRAA